MKHFLYALLICLTYLFSFSLQLVSAAIPAKPAIKPMQLVKDPVSGQLRLPSVVELTSIQGTPMQPQPAIVQHDDSHFSAALDLHPLPATLAYLDDDNNAVIEYGRVPIEVVQVTDDMFKVGDEYDFNDPSIQRFIFSKSSDYSPYLLSSYQGSSQKPADIVIQSADFQGDENTPGEGFFDPTPVEAVGGNEALTLGEQRLNVFLEAARIWGEALLSDVPIYVNASFTSLTCNSSSGVLGSAGPNTVHVNFENVPHADTWYVGALANSLSGQMLGEGTDINALFNSSIDNNDNCLNGINWYLGLDGNHGSDIDLLTIVLHEMAHGLGFISLVDVANGSLLPVEGDTLYHDVWDHYLYGVRLGTWLNLTDDKRAFSARSEQNLVWQGDNLTLHASEYSEGLHEVGLFKMYAPNPVELGSSVSHFDKSVTPNTLMEPVFTEHTTDVGLAGALLEDIGWLRPETNTLSQ
ncbi:hypothetical protein [uncultured Shewanella sp.]|uniref:hypothetical protein n=1 Tax=uncultured Shewanella sp. TaxID=173975 RepID=UPI00262552D7|nr:hypothetical protein [uncultured Shewanella sp.]